MDLSICANTSTPARRSLSRQLTPSALAQGTDSCVRQCNIQKGGVLQTQCNHKLTGKGFTTGPRTSSLKFVKHVQCPCGLTENKCVDVAQCVFFAISFDISSVSNYFLVISLLQSPSFLSSPFCSARCPRVELAGVCCRLCFTLLPSNLRIALRFDQRQSRSMPIPCLRSDVQLCFPARR